MGVIPALFRVVFQGALTFLSLAFKGCVAAVKAALPLMRIAAPWIAGGVREGAKLAAKGAQKVPPLLGKAGRGISSLAGKAGRNLKPLLSSAHNQATAALNNIEAQLRGIRLLSSSKPVPALPPAPEGIKTAAAARDARAADIVDDLPRTSGGDFNVAATELPHAEAGGVMPEIVAGVTPKTKKYSPKFEG